MIHQSEHNLYSHSWALAVRLVLTQLIVMPLYETNSKYNVLKHLHMVYLLCPFVG